MSDEQTPNFDALFPESADLTASVGSAEIEARKLVGNDRYDEIVKFNDDIADSGLQFNRENGRRVGALANLYQSLAETIPVMFLLMFFLAMCWSIFFWVIWALH